MILPDDFDGSPFHPSEPASHIKPPFYPPPGIFIKPPELKPMTATIFEKPLFISKFWRGSEPKPLKTLSAFEPVPICSIPGQRVFIAGAIPPQVDWASEMYQLDRLAEKCGGPRTDL